MRALLAIGLVGIILSAGCDRFEFSRPASDDPVYSEQQLGEMIHASPLVLVKFGAPWCGPCQRVDAELSKVTGDVDIVTVNVDNNPKLADTYDVSGIPHMILFRDGQQVGSLVGFHSANEISKWTAGVAAAKGSAIE